MREIQLTKGFVALVDDEDFESVSAYRWRVLICKRAFYAIRTVRIDGKRMSEGMHRFILGVTDPKIQVDHENHDGLDNRRHNLRLATCSQNCANQRMTSRNKSGFKGVCWNKVAKKWSAEIWANRKKTYLGLFATPEQASDVYLEAVQKLHGEFALRRVELPDTRASLEGE